MVAVERPAQAPIQKQEEAAAFDGSHWEGTKWDVFTIFGQQDIRQGRRGTKLRQQNLLAIVNVILHAHHMHACSLVTTTPDSQSSAKTKNTRSHLPENLQAHQLLCHHLAARTNNCRPLRRRAASRRCEDRHGLAKVHLSTRSAKKNCTAHTLRTVEPSSSAVPPVYACARKQADPRTRV